MRLVTIAGLLTLLSIAPAFSQEPNTPAQVNPSAAAIADRVHRNVPLSIAILAFGAIVLGLQVYVNINTEKPEGGKVQGWGPQSVRLYCLTLIIIAVLFLVTLGYPLTELATAFALLGTLAGFLFGKAEN
jgi:hypothetical protein